MADKNFIKLNDIETYKYVAIRLGNNFWMTINDTEYMVVVGENDEVTLIKQEELEEWD